MTNATLDRLLALLVVAMAATGLASLRVGGPGGGWLFVVHGVLGGCLAAGIVLKLRRSVPGAVRRRSWGRLALGLGVSIVASAALVGGMAWVAGGRLLSIGSWTVLTLHAWAGLVLVPIVVVHLLPHRWRLLRPASATARREPRGVLSRRSVLAGGTLLAAGGTIAAATAVLDRLNGGARRFTGSRELPAGGIPPTTTFLGEPTPDVDAAAWRVTVGGAVHRAASLTLADLEALGTADETAILDCTSGWFIETGWRGIPLAALLDAASVGAGARRVTVRSVTGWTAVLPLDEARRCLLATGVAGVALPVANGAPIRLVAPDRRGLDWVKWVDRIEVA
jgi:DMSO/TMAO reductase YedYZ molybdopterin-dependent catalytic subunit